MGLLLEFLIEVVVEVFAEIFLELGISSFKSAFDRPDHNPVLAALGYLLFGALLAGISLFIWPERLTTPGPLPGVSLVLGPLIAGIAMHAWGRYRRDRGHITTNLATFYGGAAFAFGLAIARFAGTP